MGDCRGTLDATTAKRIIAAVMSPRDFEILTILTKRVRLLTLEQAARTWWRGTADPKANALRAIDRLQERGWLYRVSLNARPELDLKGPVTVWNAGDPSPDFGKVAYRLKARWTEPIRRTIVAVATEKAGRRFGGAGGRLTQPHQVSHDLHVTALFLRLRQERPRAVSRWWGEESLRPFWGEGKIPDAAFGPSPRRIRVVIEFGNGYDKRRVQAFHEECADRGQSYELW